MVIQVDQEICNGCGECEGLIPGLVSTNRGRLVVPIETIRLYLISRAILSVVEYCPVGAISVVRG